MHHLKVSGSLLLAMMIGFGSARADTRNYTTFELQARSNLLVNDNGWNLPPGSSFNSISANINNAGKVAFPVRGGVVWFAWNRRDSGPACGAG